MTVMFRKLVDVRSRIREHRSWETARKRVQGVHQTELLAWWEATLYGSQRAREAYEKTGDPMALQEANQAIVTLQALVDELEHRAD